MAFSQIAVKIKQIIRGSAVYAALGFQPGTAEYELLEFFLPLAGSPEDLKAYFKGNCKTSVVSGELAGLYEGIQGLPANPPLTEVNACRDTVGASDSLVK
jgi:hypothetical protein